MKKIIDFKKLKVFLIVILFFILLTFLRLSWINFFYIPDGISAEKGTIDLTNVNTSTNFKLKLNGEWAFYPNKLVTEDNFTKYEESEKTYSNLPEAWNHYFNDDQMKNYGTYHLRILKEHEIPQLYGITIPEGLSSYKVYINGQTIGGLGTFTSDLKSSNTINRPMTYYFMLDSNVSNIVISGIQNNPYIKGGLSKSIIFGDFDSVKKATSFTFITQVGFFIVLALYFLFTILLSIIGIRDKTLIYFSLLAFTTAISVLVSHSRILFMIIPLDWIWANKLFYFSYTLAILLFILYLQTLIKKESILKVLNKLPLFYVIYLVFLILAPIEYIYRTIIIFKVIYIVFPVILIALIIYILLVGQKGVWYLLLTAIAVFSNSLSVTFNESSNQPIYYPIDLFIAVTALSAFWFTRYFQSTIDTVQLSKRLQKEIDHKDNFLANTSHELRNPLHGIMNITQTIINKKDNGLETENKESLQLLLTISNHMSFMIDDLLDLVHLKETKIQLNKVPNNILSMATSISEMYSYLLKGKRVELVNLIPNDLPIIMADENRLIQVFSNLMHNSIKFTNKGSITISAVVQGDNMIITFKDTGIGIEESKLEAIFEPYEQIDSSMTSIGGGLGLGLSICRELIQLHGGKIEVTSRVGKGSTFTVTLPSTTKQTVKSKKNSNLSNENIALLLPQYEKILSDSSMFEFEHTATTHEDQSIVTSNSRILVVDDDVVNLQVLVNMLSVDNYNVETALSGKEALGKLENGKFDLVISDIMMPNMSGYELAKQIRKQFSISELPILFLTARRQREDINRGFLAGANDHVTKPMEYTELKARVNALVRVKQSSEERLRMEGAWLQAQIQPHFFFNTLNSIISLHTVNHEKTEELLFAFSNYLQTSFVFQNTDLIVPIENELKVVRSYIAIQQIRFGNRINVIWAIPDNIKLSVPPLSIQTIVENSIQHGILMRVEGGTITIKIEESDKQFTVSIIDDGIGFDLKETKDKQSVGLVNTSLRLKQLFDTKLNFESVSGKGTTVSFIILKDSKND